MVVETCIKPKLHDDSEDDDEPIMFKRSKTTSTQNQVNLEMKKVSSQRHDGSSKRQFPDTSSPNGQNLSLHMGKVVSSEKLPQSKSPIANSKASTSLADKSKQSPRQNSRINNIEKKPLNKPRVKRHADSEDSEDGRPLSIRLPVASGASQKSNSSNVTKVHSSPPHLSMSEKVDIKKSSEDSDDEIPLSSKFQLKAGGGSSIKKSYDSDEDDIPLSSKFQLKAGGGSSIKKSYDSDEDEIPLSSKFQLKADEASSIKKSYDSDEDEIPLSSKFQLKSCGASSVKKSRDSDEEKKPLASKIQQNGSIKKESDLKSPKVLNKRPLGDINTSVQSSVKKPKLLDASVSAKVKQVCLKAEAETEDDDGDDIPIAQRMKKSTASDSKSQSTKRTTTKVVSSSLKKTPEKSKKVKKNSKYSKSTKLQPSSGEGKKWNTLVHNGVIFPPPYKPHGVKMLYNDKPVDLTPEQEEVATMFAVMQDTDYANKEKFRENFMKDWSVILGENHVIKELKPCVFTPIYEWHQKEKEKKKQMSTEEKKALKEEKLKQEEKYMWAVVDGVKEKVGNFRVEPPGLFRGRGDHPKMGRLKKRIRPSDITINIGKGAPIPECPIPGERWKEVKHDNTVTWLAFWNDPINPKEFKYVFLAASSSLKGQSDREKYEKARLLKDYIQDIRVNYTKDFVNKDLAKRQIAVATYLIDKLALRAGNEKDDDEAETVGCCTLKVDSVKLDPPNKLEFDFLGKDSIKYKNTVEVEPLVYKAIGQFKTGKTDKDDLFDKLDTNKLNAHLKEIMPGLTAKVFRTYNASITLDEMLNKETKDGDVAQKVVVYQHANKEVAHLCNHQRSISKSHDDQMLRLTGKMDELKAVLNELKTDLARVKKGKPPLKDADGKQKRNLAPDALERKINQTNSKIEKMERDMRTKEDLKTVALGTSKINYLDPRISVAWCKRHEVPIEKIFNKSLLAKFSWAMDVDPSFRF